MAKKEVALLEDLNSKIKAVIETQSVLRDGMSDTRRYLRLILDRIEEIEATSEVMKLSLRRKVDMKELGTIEKRIIDMERRFSSVKY
ncbi:hypothetical protein COX95_00810 [bacterium CG_4_10_14_0_2_um_filter_33_32]|nr:MAG: hypothetical protein AUJ93_02405 [bacterium CG2_30_33_46]PIR67354.1 MAG: hypothetical protein COU50_03490 [bacterium CG10_big_fil_rev_8_21_14_0_10_33_18]PIU76741.1 MAG: hypothetical protein COS74_02250 [bacterium CG06_land_8_20_14_3_00_33_50]PIW81313.1 MAG: hypothetical protein COZ97_02635 [bacterium CG_4_8_14_3_um_filter_33_28]PIY85698.1 MAG: hypothetical protein COY76_00605 [bacterium CG_4_10_14_0_8_um_filter_33_57]PIZ86599.1 MAG: hypothetical protein COX95_00810 [bacterium CG_4_10_1